MNQYIENQVGKGSKWGKSSIPAIFLLEFRFVPLSSSTTMKLYFQYVTNINFLEDGNGPQYLQC